MAEMFGQIFAELFDVFAAEAQTSAYMKNPNIDIEVELGIGTGKATVWTCDLTKEYVEINGDYRS